MPRMKIPMHRYAITLPLAALCLTAPTLAKPALAAADDEITITVVGDTGYSRNGQPVEPTASGAANSRRGPRQPRPSTRR